jgi:hypothetical protein
LPSKSRAIRVLISFLTQVLLRYALALFKYCEEEVLKCEDAGSSLECLQRTANTILDADQLAQVNNKRSLLFTRFSFYFVSHKFHSFYN